MRPEVGHHPLLQQDPVPLVVTVETRINLLYRSYVFPSVQCQDTQHIAVGSMLVVVVLHAIGVQVCAVV